MFRVGQLGSTSWVNDALGKAGLRNVLRLERSVGRSVVYPVALVAECLAKGPTMWGQRVSVRRRKSGECWSITVMMSAKEGLLAPAF